MISISALRRLIENVPPDMIIRGFLYPYLRSYRTVRSTQPGLKGFRFWKTVLTGARRPILGPPPPSGEFESPGAVRGIIRNRDAVIFQLPDKAVRFSALHAGLIRIQASRDGLFPERRSYSVEKPPEQWNGGDLQVRQDEKTVEITTDILSITINLNPFTFSAAISGETGSLLSRSSVRNQESGASWFWEGRFAEETAFYGLGEKAEKLNLAGKQYELLNTDPAGYSRGDDPIYLSVPFITSLSGAGSLGLFFDNSYHSWFDLGRASPGKVSYKTQGGGFCLYLMAGKPKEILNRYTELTGRIKLLPLWALGFHQCRWSYYPEARVDRVAEEFRRRRLPCDGIHIDIHYMDGYRCFTWNRKRFPDPPKMIRRLQNQGFKVLTILDPGLKADKKYEIFREGTREDMFIKYPDGKAYTGPVWPGKCLFPDFSSARVRDWWGKLYRILIEDGVDAFWNDMNEAAIITNRPGRTNFIPDEVIHHGDYGLTDHSEIRNLYGMLMVRASREGLDSLLPDKRTLLMTRSGWAGVQRYATHWTGDNGSTWDHLLLSIQICLNLGISGIPVTGPDIGGFSGTCTPELFARWMEAGVLMPFYRVHTWFGAPDQEPWTFGKEVEDISRKYLELRYTLLPVLYTAMRQAAADGTPMMRPLFFDYPEDPETYNLDDQFLCGDSLLAAPVVRKGAESREVYLPKGTWYDFWTRESQSGPKKITADAPLDHLPLFVRAGSVIPRWPVQQYTGEKIVDTVTLEVYSGDEDMSSRLYEDDGVTPEAHQKDKHTLSRFTCRRESEALVLRREIESGEYRAVSRKWLIKFFGMNRDPKKAEGSGFKISDVSDGTASIENSILIEAGDNFELKI